MRLFRNITFQLWLPNAAIFVFGSVALALYYPKHQQQTLRQQRLIELKEIGQSISGVLTDVSDSISLYNAFGRIPAYAGVKKSVNILVSEDTPGSGQAILKYAFPAGADLNVLRADSERFLNVSVSYRSTSRAGKVELFEDASGLERLVWEINFPIYALLGGSFVVTMIVFYFVALRVSGPIRELNRKASSLIADDRIREARDRSGNELERLGESITSLQESLVNERSRNAELTKGLEEEVRVRTAELSRKNTYLEHAARILRHDMHSGINTYLPRGINSLLRRLNPETIEANSLDAPIRLIKEGLAHTQKVYQGIYEFTNLVKPGSKLNLVSRDLRTSLLAFLSTTSYKDQVIIDELGTHSVSESLFCTAIDNLIRNGLKYNDSPTKLVRISRPAEDTLEVQDNGRGLTQEEFTLFSSTGTRREGQQEGGSGLGLGICVAILQEHGYTITCEKRTDQGTSIKIKIA